MESSLLQISWDDFRKYLLAKSNRKDVGYYVNLARKYSNVITTGDASELLTLTQFQRKHAMGALTDLSKFLGCYKRWHETVENYNLKWQEPQEFVLFAKPDITNMMQYMQGIKRIIPEPMYDTFIFGTLTGLRAAETCQSIALIQNDKDGYYSDRYGVLQHYKFQDLFFRKSKKAYVSIVDNDILDYAKNANPSYQAIRGCLRRNGLECNMAYCRKIFATYLRDAGIPTEIVDLLQGRVSHSIFAMHYYRPDFNGYADRIRRLLGSLCQEITA